MFFVKTIFYCFFTGIFVFLLLKIKSLINEISSLTNENVELKKTKEQLLEHNNQLSNEKQKIELELSKLQGEVKSIHDNQQQKDALQKEMQLMFQNLSNTTLEKQTELGQKKINEMLKPFQHEIDECKKAIESTNKINNETTGIIKGKIDEMIKQTLTIGDKADKLATAFEGDKKQQGNFGELKFENLLNFYNFEKNTDYYEQYLLTTEEQKKKYPDFILQAQPKKWLVIDSKFSIINYKNYLEATHDEDKKIFFEKYVNDIKQRITELGEKEYNKLLQQNGKETFDFTCLFFGCEMAYLTAISDLKYREEIFRLSAKYKVAILTSSSFSPILQMIKQLWNIEKTNENIEKAREIIEKWLIKITDFNENLEKIGKGIENVKNTYNDAVKQLQNGNGNAIKLAKDVVEMIDIKLKPKNGKERELKDNLFLIKNED